MHHSQTIREQSTEVTCYLDESAIDGSTPTAVVGGLVLNQSGFALFDKRWKRMIDRCNLHPALHMKDFGKNGRFRSKTENERRAIMEQASRIILETSVCTIAATLEHELYRRVFPPEMRAQMNSYGFCFIVCAMMNKEIAGANRYDRLISLVLDSGNAYAAHVKDAYETLRHA